MTTSPEFVAQPIRLSVSIKLAGIFLLLLLVAAGNLYFVRKIYDSITNVANIINQSGQLRYLSLQVALESASFIQKPDKANIQTLLIAADEYKMRYASVASEIKKLHPLMRSTGDDLEEHLGHINKVWQHQHAVLEWILVEPDITTRQAAHREVRNAAEIMLKEAGHLASALERASTIAHQRVNLAIYLALALEIPLILILFFYVRSRISAPIINLTNFSRRFAAGERSVRMDFHSHDEIGELVLTFNTTATQTMELIGELDRSARENAMLAGILEATTDIVSAASPEGRLFYLNRTGRKMLGVAEDEKLDRYTITDFLSPDAAEYHFRIVRPAALREGTCAMANTLRSLTGAEIPVSQVIIAHKDENGMVDYYSAIMRDTTHFKMLKQQLQSSLDFHLKLMQNFPNLIWRANGDGKCDYVNHTWLEFTGRTLEQELGDGWMDDIHPDDYQRCKDAFLSAIAQKKLFTFEYRMHHRNGGYRWVLDHGSPYTGLDGEYAGYIGACYDIDDRKQAELQLLERELQYRTLADSGQALIWASGTDKLCNYFNKVWLEFTGRSMELELGNGWAEGVHSDDLQRCLDTYVAAFDRRKKFSMVYRLRRHDGEYRWILDDGCPCYDSNGEFIGYIGYCLDITAHKLAEDALNKLNEELEDKVEERTVELDKARHDAEQANRAKSAFLATMSHEIRTPMNGVIGMVDVLQQSSLQGSQVEMVDLIQESAFSLLTIIDDILDFSKIEAGRLQIEKVPLLLADTVETVCSMLDRLASRRKVELTLFIDPAIPEVVLGDALRLRQVLTNLIHNAVKFSGGQDRQSKVSVRAVVAERRPEQVTVEFQITDNGIGMNREILARLFTPFSQADISTTRKFGGTGLGLSISQQLTNLMDGEITAQSEPDKGSTFTVHLPFGLLPEGTAADKVPSEVAGLSCLVVGNGTSGDLAAYLMRGGAVVEQVADLVAAGKRAGMLPSGLWIWIIVAREESPSPDNLRAVVRGQPEQDVHFVVIGRGQRRKPRVAAPDLVMLDGNVLKRRTFLKAVAIAAGRVQEDVEMPFPGEGKTTAKPPSREEARRQGKLILVAEDNEVNQKVVLRQLALLGFAADIADNGRLALERWQSGDYVLLLSDLHMPEMDGYGLTAAIRAMEQGSRHIPIIALTANAQHGEAERCREAGMDDYLSKPVRLAELQAVLEKWLPVVASGSIPAGAIDKNIVRAAPAEVIHSSFDKLSPNGLQASVPAPVDVNVLKSLIGDDAVVIREFLNDFRISAVEIAAEMKAACNGRQAGQVGALAHKLKSSARSVGALALGELCAAMEQAGKAGDAEILAVLLPRFEAEMAAVDGYLGAL